VIRTAITCDNCKKELVDKNISPKQIWLAGWIQVDTTESLGTAIPRLAHLQFCSHKCVSDYYAKKAAW
jgi:hypothetical protein